MLLINTVQVNNKWLTSDDAAYGEHKFVERRNLSLVRLLIFELRYKSN